MKKLVVLSLLTVVAGAALAVGPPSKINYQGVLRQPSGLPVDATHDMIFRFFDTESGGTALLVDEHSGAQAVTIANGLFSVALGTGSLTGPHGSLDAMFRNEPTVWMQLEVSGDVLLPRIEVLSSAYSLMSSDSLRLGGLTDASFLRANADDTAIGRITFTDTPTGSNPMDAPACINPPSAGGLDTLFGIAVDGEEKVRVNGFGTVYATSQDWGFYGRGNSGGGYFRDLDHSGYAYVGVGDRGIQAYGTSAGGWFTDLNGTGQAWTAIGNSGVEGRGSYAGGFFWDSDNSGYSYLGYGDLGIRGGGNTAGGFFLDVNNSGHAYVGYGNYGVWGSGSTAGAYFKDSDNTSSGYVGIGTHGIRGYGDTLGGQFVDNNSSSYAYLAYGDYGIQAYGNEGAYFKQTNSTAYSWLAEGDIGVSGEGNSQGGFFRDINAGTYVRTGYSTASTWGNGSKNFVQNHPYDKNRVVVYTALEGDEAATYTRGSAQLVNGEATIKLGDTFQWVTNPDVGLTAHLTPRGKSSGLYVESLSTTTLVVRSDDNSDTSFDYVVFGLRVGFEASTVVREKEVEAYLPSMDDHHQMIARNPTLAGYTALERFTEMEAERRGVDRAAIDLSAGRALADAVTHFDPAIHKPRDSDVEMPDRAALAPPEPETNAPATDSTTPRAAPSVTTIVERTAHELPAVERLDRVRVSESVAPGDVLTIDLEHPGRMRLAASIADPGVIGVVAEPAIDGEAPIRVTGIVELKVDAGFGAIRPGDLLTSSPTAGHAMRATEALPGTILGKALGSLDAGTGTLEVLMMLR